MSENKKSILAETLEDIQNVKQQIEENANYALSSTLKEELHEIVKNGLAENFSSDDETPQDIATDDTVVDSIPTDAAPVSDEVPSDINPELGSSEEVPGAEGGEEVIDLTGASPEEVLGSFKLMAPTDEIEIVRSEDGIAINFSPEGESAVDAENSIENSTETLPIPGAEGGEAAPADVPSEEPTVNSDSPEEEEKEKVYEIEITECDDEVNETPVDEAMSHHMGMKRRDIVHNENDPLRVEETAVVDETAAPVTEEAPVSEETKEEDSVEENVNETHDKLVAARKKNQALMLENKNMKTYVEEVKTKVAEYVALEKQYKEAINTYKAQLQEVALFTSNLTYAIKLMTENTTTRDEKVQILKRLDSAKTITESCEVYKTLDESFKNNKSANPTTIIETKILGDDKTSGASKINETSVYTNPQVDRIKEIISKLSK